MPWQAVLRGRRKCALPCGGCQMLSPVRARGAAVRASSGVGGGASTLVFEREQPQRIKTKTCPAFTANIKELKPKGTTNNCKQSAQWWYEYSTNSGWQGSGSTSFTSSLRVMNGFDAGRCLGGSARAACVRAVARDASRSARRFRPRRFFFDVATDAEWLVDAGCSE